MSNILKGSSIALHTARSFDVSDVFCEPIAMTSAYEFISAQDAYEKFSGIKAGNIYSRFTNPTITALEQRVAAH